MNGWIDGELGFERDEQELQPQVATGNCEASNTEMILQNRFNGLRTALESTKDNNSSFSTSSSTDMTEHMDLPIEDQLYSVWRSHVDKIYDFYAQHFLEYPSNTVSFVHGSRKSFKGDFAMHQVYVGTTAPHTQNYITMYNVFVPSELEDEEKEEEEGNQPDYTDVANVIQRVTRVHHDGPVTRVRPLPQNPSIICARGRKSQLSVYNLSTMANVDSDAEEDICSERCVNYRQERHRQISRQRATAILSQRGEVMGLPAVDISTPPTAVLRGPKKPGIGIQWHHSKEGYLAVACEDETTYIFNLEGSVVADSNSSEAIGVGGASVGPCISFQGHSGAVNDVSWNASNYHSLMSAGHDCKAIFWDIRAKKKQLSAELHKCPILSAQFHPNAAFVFATGSMDGPVRIWDFRRLSQPVYSFIAHRGPVIGLQWAPFNDGVLLSHGCDGCVVCWDLSKAEIEPSQCDVNCRPELVFQHYGHDSPVRDACWCGDPQDAWTVASVDDHNMMQLWSPAPYIINDNLDPDNVVENFN